MNEDVSGFLEPVTAYGEADLSTFTLIHSSEEGIYALYRGERAGLFRVYKCLKPQWCGCQLQEEMLKKEFALSYPLRHPNIRETFQYTRIEGLGNCIEMEWVDGVPLNEFLKRGRPDEKTFRRMASELCDAISYLHNRQTIHRDIKPSNILVTHDGCNIKLIDFSLADNSSSSILKAPAGTRNYIAPEVLQGRPGDIRSDIWSLGKVLGEMTSRHKAAIAKCTKARPENRYATVQQVKEALFTPFPWYIPAALILVGIALAMFLLRPPGNQEAVPVITATPAVPVQRPDSLQQRDTVVQPPAKTEQKKRAKEIKKADEPDDLFRQATELFDGLL